MTPTRTTASTRRTGRSPWRALACALAVLVAAPAAAFDEPVLKAAIVFRLLGFVEWPPQRMPAPGGALVLCVERGHALVNPLRQLASANVRQWLLEVREAPPAALALCHGWMGGQPPSGLGGAGPLLVLSDGGGGDELTHIRLVRDGDRIGFELDLRHARRSGVQISARLARLARAVHE